MSRSKSQQGGASSSSSLLGLRSPIASLFNFRKIRKQALNKAATQQRNAFSAMGNPASPRMEEQSKQAEMFNVPLQNTHYGNTFVTKEDRTGVGNAAPSDTQLERELFLVLGDLERTLVQEQSDCGRAPSTPSYGSRRQFRSGYSSERGLNNILGDTNVYNESSGAYYPDGTRTLKPNELFRSHSTYRPQRFFEMYSNRHRTPPKQGYFQRQTSNESPPMSPINGNRSFSSSADIGKFSFSSWNLPFLRHSSSGFLHRGNHKDSKRTPISEIVWNSPPPSSPEENSAQAFRAQSLMDLSNVKQVPHRKSSHHNCMYDFYRSQQNVYDAAAQKESQFSTFPHQEETRQAPSDSSNNMHSVHVVSGTAQPTEREIPCPDIVPMQTDSAWDEGNKENCPDTDPYDSDATLHSSDTMSDDDMEVIETGIGEQPATEPTFSGTGVLPSQQTHPSLANELNVQNIYSQPATDLTPQYEYSCSASEVTPKHKISTHAKEHATQNQTSSPAAELLPRHEHPYPSADVPPQYEHAFTAVATFNPKQVTSPPVAVVQPLEHGLSLTAKLPSQHEYTSRATATLFSQTSAVQLHPQPVYSTSAVYELQLKHGRQHSTVINEQQGKYGGLHSAGVAKLQSEYGYPPLPDELTFQPGHSLPAEDNSKPLNPSSAEYCSQHGYPPPTELPAKHGYPPPAELPTKHGYPPPAELPTKHGQPPPAELPTKHGYPPPAELPTKQEYPPSAEHPTKQEYPPSADLPTKHGYPPPVELPTKHGYPPPAEHPTKQGYPPPTELPSKNGYPPSTELPLKQSYLPSVELLPKQGYLHSAVLRTKEGYPLPAVLPLQNGYPSSPAPPSNYECPPHVEITSQDGYPLPSVLPAKHGYPPVAEIPAQHVYSPPGELRTEHGHFPLAKFPSEYKHSSPDKLLSEHECPPPASGEIPYDQDKSPHAASCTGVVNIQCDLHTPPSENTSIDPLFVDSSLSGTNDDSSNFNSVFSSSSSASVRIKKALPGAPQIVDYTQKAYSIADQTSAETITTCTTDLKLQPQFSHREKASHICNVRKAGNVPSTIGAQQEDQQSSISSTYPVESMQSNSSALIEDNSPSTSNTHSAVGSNLSSGLQYPAFSRSATTTKTFQMRVFSIASSLGSEDQTKYSVLYRHPKVLPEITHASKPKFQGLHGEPQKIPETKPVDKIYHETNNGNIFLSSSRSINNGISCEKTPFQRSRNKSNADLHGSLPDISNTHDSLDLAHSTILPKSTDWPTSDCESIASRNVGMKAGRYTSILLHASSLPNLDLTQSFLQKNSEDSELKFRNLKLTISESHNNPNTLIKKQDTLAPRQHKMIDDPANKQHLAQSTKSQAKETKVSTHWKILEKHEDLLTMDSERSTVSVENTPDIFPSKNSYCKSLEMSYTNSLKCKDTDTPEVNPQASPFGSIIAEGLSAEQDKKIPIALKKDPSSHTSLAANADHQNGHIKISSPAIQGTPFSTPRVGDSQADPTYISVANANTNENLNNENGTASSKLTHSLLYRNIKAKSESTLAGRVLNGLHKSKFPEDQSVKSAISDNFISVSGFSKTEDKTENTTPLSDLVQTIGQLHKNKTPLKINGQPIHQRPGYDLPSANSESKPADTKTTQPALPINSFSVLSDLPGENNSFSPESQKLICPSINRVEPSHFLKLSTSTNDTSHCDKSDFPDTFTSQCDLVLNKPVCDSSVKPVSTNITAIRVKPNLPGGRLWGDHLHVYTTKRRVSPLSPNQQNNSSTLSGDQPNTPTPVSISEDPENFREKKDITISHNLNTNGDPTGTHINGQSHPPDVPSEAQRPEDVSLHHGKAGFFPSSDGLQPGKTLKEYKTKSTRSFVATEDKIEYRELVSVYYSLPRRRSKPLSVASTDKNILSPNSILNRKQEFHIDLANTAYPVSRFLGERLSTDTLLSDVTTQENVDETNSSRRRALTRSTSWDEREQTTISPSRICSTKNVSPTIPWNVNDTFSPDEIAFNPSGSDRYSNIIGSTSDQVAAKSAAITDDDKYHFFKSMNIEGGEPFYLSRPLNASSLQFPEQAKSFLHHSTGMHPLQSTDLERRQNIPQGKEDFNQNIVEENLFSGTDNKREPGNKHINAKHCLSQSHANADEKAFTYRSQMQNKFRTDQAGSPLNKWEGGLDSANSQDVVHPASEKAFSKGRSFSDSHSNYPHPKCNPPQTTMDNSSTVLLQAHQNTKGGPISPGKQLGKEERDMHIYANPIEDSYALYPKDRVVDTLPEQTVSPTIENVNRFSSDDTSENVCEQVKSSYEPYSAVDWEQIYKITNRRHSYQDARHKPASSTVTLRRGQSDSYVQLNKQKTLSPTTSPLQSLLEDAYDKHIPPDSKQAFLRKLDKSYAPQVGSHKPVSPTGVSRGGALKNMYTQKEYPCRIKRRGSDPTRKLTNTSPSFMYKSFPDENARNKNAPKLSSTFESPEEFDSPSPTAHDRLRNHSRMPHCHDVTLMPYAEDNRNVFTDTGFQKSGSPEQNNFLNDWDITPWDEERHVHRTKSLKNLNLQGGQTGFTDKGDKSGRRFSTTTNIDKAYGRHPSSPTLARAFKYNRKFWSHSELMSTDENDNWDTYGSTRHRPTRSYSTSPTVGFGIFGKEQQLAFLENIKRSLTEGRLWRPCYLKNPGFLRREADNPVESTVLPNSTFDTNTITVQGMPPRQTLNIYRDDPVIYSSNSDTDTTTDDEYYLDEFDKESEL